MPSRVTPEAVTRKVTVAASRSSAAAIAAPIEALKVPSRARPATAWTSSGETLARAATAPARRPKTA